MRTRWLKTWGTATHRKKKLIVKWRNNHLLKLRALSSKPPKSSLWAIRMSAKLRLSMSLWMVNHKVAKGRKLRKSSKTSQRSSMWPINRIRATNLSLIFGTLLARRKFTIWHSFSLEMLRLASCAIQLIIRTPLISWMSGLNTWRIVRRTCL